MRVWLVTVGEPVPLDGPDVRLHRAGLLCDFLSKAGHDVTWWTSTFDHAYKRHRYACTERVQLANGARMIFMRSTGYSRNVSIRRIVDHFLLGRLFGNLARREVPPDAIVSSYPTIDLASASVAYGNANSVPVVLDVRDLWPEIFLELGPKWARPFLNACASPLWAAARKAFQNATAITGNGHEFVRWGLRLANRPAGALDRPFPFGYRVPEIGSDDKDAARGFWKSLGVGEDAEEFVVCFFGAIGRQFDLETVVDAVLRLTSEGHAVKAVLCGLGERLDALKRQAAGCASIVFPGWVGQKQIWALMETSSIGLAPYVGGIGFEGNMPNKIAEYLAAGLPIVSSLEGYVGKFLRSNACGVTYRRGDVSELVEVLKRLLSQRRELATMAVNARRAFDATFSADKIYGEMIEYIRDVVASGVAGKHHVVPRYGTQDVINGHSSQ